MSHSVKSGHRQLTADTRSTIDGGQLDGQPTRPNTDGQPTRTADSLTAYTQQHNKKPYQTITRHTKQSHDYINNWTARPHTPIVYIQRYTYFYTKFNQISKIENMKNRKNPIFDL